MNYLKKNQRCSVKSCSRKFCTIHRKRTTIYYFYIQWADTKIHRKTSVMESFVWQSSILGLLLYLKADSITGVRFYNIFQTAIVLDTNERLFTSSCTKSKVKCWIKSCFFVCLPVTKIKLTYLSPLFPFYTPWTLAKNGLKLKENI